MATAQDIVSACEAVWDANKSDCNMFVRAVAGVLGVHIAAGNADAIINALLGPIWTRLSDGTAAKQAADTGDFVLAGLKAAKHNPPRANGHVAIVVMGPLDSTHNKYPTAYWGSLGSVGRKNSTLNYSWNAADRDNVEYFKCSL